MCIRDRCITGAAYSSDHTYRQDTWKAWVFKSDGTFSRHELTMDQLSARANLMPRDLLTISADAKRAISTDNDKSRPVIVPKSTTVLLTLSHIKVAITRDSMILFDVHRPVVQYFGLGFAEYLSRLHEARTYKESAAACKPLEPQLFDFDGDGTLDEVEFHKFMTAPLHERSPDQPYRQIPFECKALDGILSAIGTKYAQRLEALVPTVSRVLDELEIGSSQTHVKLAPSALQEVLTMKNALGVLENSVESMAEVISTLLSNDEDMVEILLTEKHERGGTAPPVDQHDEVELLLETHLRELTTLGREAKVLRRRIMATQEIVNINLDNYRNRIIQVNVGISILSLGCASSVIGASFAGMNLVSGLEEHPTMFWWTCAGCLGLGASMSLIPMIRMSKYMQDDRGSKLIGPHVLERLLGNHEGDMQDIVISHMRRRGNEPMTLEEFTDMMTCLLYTSPSPRDS
eukprot:TRINITY_DN5081_c0_g1_i7.p1 TRINITY_DN5081_c0_g1~~TRINITY_DN5081_c0_g1_i7.p1  ORF type:complete len:461 (-),score=126.89 TRINITY_DN5081_c0_g1_i7:96-1478(-)